MTLDELIKQKNLAIQDAMCLEAQAKKRWEDAGDLEIALVCDGRNKKFMPNLVSAVCCYEKAGNCEDKIVIAKQLVVNLS